MKLKYIGVCFFSLLIGILLFLGNQPRAEERPENLNSESVSAGVIVHGHDSPGWIQNTNSVPVSITQVWVFRGETTEWTRVFKPMEKESRYISNQHGFHISTVDGGNIGWIRPYQNGLASK